ncbi:MAG TPA: fructosamine kinase family protein [Steroidobacteraceae bacterium]|jgi:fructosamine-3-kinase|nr:fructosamine kinase family protein [Steroidobacteraceae bacterium]
MAHFENIARELGALVGGQCAAEPERRVGGGSINTCYAWRCGAGLLFVKVAARSGLGTFAAESAGLAALAAAHALRVPRVLACAATEQAAFLALEWIERGRSGEPTERRLGEGLAALHRVTAARFGFAHDNFIGATPQRNDWDGDWARFFAEQRLRPQLRLAARNGLGSRLQESGERLLAAVPALLAGHQPTPCLLHGDLWGGNWFADGAGRPVVFDPAVYYGDPEADLAMSRLFGGFAPGFYRAYAAAAPLTAGAEVRAELYNLYHVLNHANLFGGGYAAQAHESIARLLAQAGG